MFLGKFIGLLIGKRQTVSRVIAAAFISLVGVSKLQAQATYAWTSTSSTTLTLASNWSLVSGTANANGYPGSSDTVSIVNAAGTTNTVPANVRVPASSTYTVANWSFIPTAPTTWQASSQSTGTGGTLVITNTLTMDNASGYTGTQPSMTFKDYSTASPLSLSVGAIAAKDGNLYLGQPGSSTIYSVSVSGLTTIGGGTTVAVSRIDVTLEATPASTANFAGGVNFSGAATSGSIEYFNFNTSTSNNSASVAFLSGGYTGASAPYTPNRYALLQGGGTVAATSTLILNGNDANANLFGGSIADTTSGTIVTAVTKTGTDTQVFFGANNTYTGGTIISGGNLQINNASGSALGTGAVTLNGGTNTTLSGTGSASGLVTVTNGSRLAPGTNGAGLTVPTSSNFGGVATLTLGALKLTSANLDFDISNVTNSTTPLSDDVINISTGGALTLGSIAVTFNGSSLLTNTQYVLIHYTSTGTLTGDATAFTGTNFVGGLASAGYTATYGIDTAADNVYVTFAVPEPASLSLLAFGGLALVRRRRGNWKLA